MLNKILGELCGSLSGAISSSSRESLPLFPEARSIVRAVVPAINRAWASSTAHQFPQNASAAQSERYLAASIGGGFADIGDAWVSGSDGHAISVSNHTIMRIIQYPLTPLFQCTVQNISAEGSTVLPTVPRIETEAFSFVASATPFKLIGEDNGGDAAAVQNIRVSSSGGYENIPLTPQEEFALLEDLTLGGALLKGTEGVARRNMRPNRADVLERHQPLRKVRPHSLDVLSNEMLGKDVAEPQMQATLGGGKKALSRSYPIEYFGAMAPVITEVSLDSGGNAVGIDGGERDFIAGLNRFSGSEVSRPVGYDARASSLLARNVLSNGEMFDMEGLPHGDNPLAASNLVYSAEEGLRASIETGVQQIEGPSLADIEAEGNAMRSQIDRFAGGKISSIEVLELYQNRQNSIRGGTFRIPEKEPALSVYGNGFEVNSPALGNRAGMQDEFIERQAAVTPFPEMVAAPLRSQRDAAEDPGGYEGGLHSLRRQGGGVARAEPPDWTENAAVDPVQGIGSLEIDTAHIDASLSLTKRQRTERAGIHLFLSGGPDQGDRHLLKPLYKPIVPQPHPAGLTTQQYLGGSDAEPKSVDPDDTAGAMRQATVSDETTGKARLSGRVLEGSAEPLPRGRQGPITDVTPGLGRLVWVPPMASMVRASQAVEVVTAERALPEEELMVSAASDQAVKGISQEGDPPEKSQILRIAELLPAAPSSSDLAQVDAETVWTSPLFRHSTGLADPSLPQSAVQPFREPPPTPAQQIALAIQDSKSQGVELRLQPEELGPVRIFLRQDGELLRVVVQAERGETLDLLRRGSGELQQALQLAGHGSLSFSFQRPDGQGQGATAPHWQPERMEDERAEAAVVRRHLPQGRLDLRL